MPLRFIYIFFFLSPILSLAQEKKADSTLKILDEVVVSGTRTENKVSNLPLPIEVISYKNILQSGSQKLLDILQMQSGIVVASNPLGTALQGYPNPFGEGVQMQGLDPAYTLIMVDGEPLTGRNAGIINLGRIAVGNIEQIEILKGTATSLYGSDALAGVINVITKKPVKNSIGINTHYGTNNTLGVSGAGNFVGKKIALQLFVNRLSSDGYDLDKNIYGKTVDPFEDYSLNAKIVYPWNDKNKLTISGRYFSDNQHNNYLIFPDMVPQVVKGNTIETDKSIFAKWQHKMNNSVNYFTSLYTTAYTNNAAVFLEKNDSLYEKINLDQLLLRPEMQFNIGKDPASLLIAGAGYNFEKVNSTRYSSVKHLNSWYAYVQKQLHWRNRTNIIAGARFDKNSLYSAQISPKIAIAYKVTPDFILKGSVGAGFKAPDFRQQFLDFSNSLIGYTLLGARELGNGLINLKKNGQIDNSINIQPYLNGVILSPEKSIGTNLGFDYTFKNNTIFKINFFRNDISNLIETYNLPFNKTNNQSIYSYINLNKVFTEGSEITISHRFKKNFSISGSYQYLIAKDKEVLQKIKDKQLYKRDPVTGETSLVTKEEYKGLYNRSRNTAQIRLFYNNEALKGSAFITVKYRGKYGYNGLNGFQNGNDVLDDPREFVQGFVLANATISKSIGSLVEVQGGMENIFNYTNKLQMPYLYGRSIFININFKL
ncbi:MAG: TonB-dependent receptor [Bacteroidetes bacterium]|nr:TonB-dependent receptor [Bacteroidota bacterium]